MGWVCFIFLIAHQPLKGYWMPKFDTNNLHTVIWFHVFLPNNNNFQTDLFDP